MPLLRKESGLGMTGAVRASKLPLLRKGFGFLMTGGVGREGGKGASTLRRLGYAFGIGGVARTGVGGV